MSSRFRVVGSQNLTAASFSRITVNAQSHSVLGRSPQYAASDLPSLNAVQGAGELPLSSGLPIAVSNRIAAATVEGGAAGVQWAASTYDGRGDSSQDVQQGARSASSVGDGWRSAHRATRHDPRPSPSSAVNQSATGVSPTVQPPNTGSNPPTSASATRFSPPGGTGAPNTSLATSMGNNGGASLGVAPGSNGSVTSAGQGATRMVGPSATHGRGKTAGSVGRARTSRPSRSVTSAGRGGKVGPGRSAAGSPTGRASANALRGGPASVRTVRGVRSATGVVARAGVSRPGGAGGATLKTGRVATRAGNLTRTSAQAVQRIAIIFKQAALAALKGGAAAAMSPTTWVVAGIAALVLVMLLTVGQLVGGVSAGVAASQQDNGACTTTELVPEQGQAWLNEAASSSGLPPNFLARVISRESDWRPDLFAMDSNGGTWGLFQINRAEWARLNPASVGISGTPIGITDPMLHARLGGVLMKQNYETAQRLQAANPRAAYAQIDPLEAAVIIHNAGQGALMRYPNIPAITRDYAAEVMAGTSAPGTWTHPAPNGTMSSPFGYRIHPIYGDRRLHSGVDYATGPGSPIYAANSGTVTFAGFDSAGNGTIQIDHGGGISTAYLHMYASGIQVRVGQTVTAGQIIGAEGSSGTSTGSHLHFEVRQDGRPIDPVPFLDANLGQTSAGLANCGGGDTFMIAGGATPVVQTALSFQGVPYVWGGSTPAGFDCSGLVMYAYSRHGVTLPRIAHQQAFTGQNIYAGPGTGVNLSTLQPGDLIAFSNSGGANYQHIGMYVGNGKMVHAPQPGSSVTVVGLDYWKTQTWRVQRVAVNDA